MRAYPNELPDLETKCTTEMRERQFVAFLIWITVLTVRQVDAQASVLIGQSVDVGIGGTWPATYVPSTITGMQFYICSGGIVYTSAPYAGGTYGKIDEALLDGAVGASLRLSKGQIGTFDFPVTNGVAFSNVVAALTSASPNWITIGGVGYNPDRIVTGGSAYSQDNTNAFGNSLIGSRIDFFQLVVTSVDWGPSGGSFQIHGQGRWEVWGATKVVCCPRQATVTATVVNGFVVGATVIDGGCGYTNAPLVVVQGGGGSGAIANAVINGGRVTAINISNAGCCYTNTPEILVASPPFVPTLSN